MTKSKSTLNAVIVPIVIVGFLLICSISVIPTGYTGVRITFGQIDKAAVKNGFNFKIPFVQSIKKVNNKKQDIKFEGQIWSETVSRTPIYYDTVTVTYQINPQKSAWIYANITDYDKSLVSQDLVSSAIKASSKKLSDAESTNRAVIEPLAQENIQKSLNEKYGDKTVIVNKVVISEADFEESYNEAIAAKQQSQLASERQAIENQKAIDKAAADASVAKTKALADAEVKKITTDADVDRYRRIGESITPELIKKWEMDARIAHGWVTVQGADTKIIKDVSAEE